MRRALLAVAAVLGLVSAASAAPRTITLWHVFTLETDMIHVWADLVKRGISSSATVASA